MRIALIIEVATYLSVRLTIVFLQVLQINNTRSYIVEINLVVVVVLTLVLLFLQVLQQ